MAPQAPARRAIAAPCAADSGTGSATIPLGALFGLVAMPHVDVILSAVLALLLVALGAALAYAFLREMRNDTVFLEPIDVPEELSKLGYHPSVIANLLLDKARFIQRGSSGTRRRRPLENVAAVADLQLPGAGLSIRAIVRYARALFGHPAMSISGAILRAPDGYVLHLRVGSRVIEPVGGPHPPAPGVEQALHDGAEDLLQAVDPYSLASYYMMGPEAGSPEYPNAIRLIEQIVRTGTAEDRGWALGLWGTLLVAQSRFDDAMIKYRASLAAYPRIDNPVVLSNLATVLSLQGREPDALAEIATIEKRRPPVAQNLVAVANAYAALGRPDRALSAANRAIRLDRRNASAYLQRGFAFAGLHRHAEAVVALSRARELGGEISNVEFALAWQLSMVGRVEEALAVGKEAVARVPKGFQTRLALAFAQMAAGNIQEALANFEVADRAFSHFEVLKASWGDALLASGQPDAAIVKYQAAIAENPHTAMAWRGWGIALAKLGRPAEAQEKLERAAREDPHDPAIFVALAEVLELLGRADEARSRRDEAEQLAKRIAAYAKKASKA